MWVEEYASARAVLFRINRLTAEAVAWVVSYDTGAGGQPQATVIIDDDHSLFFTCAYGVGYMTRKICGLDSEDLVRLGRDGLTSPLSFTGLAPTTTAVSMAGMYVISGLTVQSVTVTDVTADYELIDPVFAPDTANLGRQAKIYATYRNFISVSVEG